jgi:hypothetical protein
LIGKRGSDADNVARFLSQHWRVRASNIAPQQ